MQIFMRYYKILYINYLKNSIKYRTYINLKLYMPIFENYMINPVILSADARNIQVRAHLFPYICQFLDAESQGLLRGGIAHLI